MNINTPHHGTEANKSSSCQRISRNPRYVRATARRPQDQVHEPEEQVFNRQLKLQKIFMNFITGFSWSDLDTTAPLVCSNTSWIHAEAEVSSPNRWWTHETEKKRFNMYLLRTRSPLYTLLHDQIKRRWRFLGNHEDNGPCHVRWRDSVTGSTWCVSLWEVEFFPT